MSDPLHTPGPDSDTSVLGLVRQLAHEVPLLVSKEIALAKAEFRESLATTRNGVRSIAGGVMLMLAGLVVVLLAVVQILAWYIALWLAALVVGIAAMIAGVVLLKAGNRQFDLSHLTPERTANALNKDKQTIQRKAS
ncbi:phage holin family protein [Pseudomonas syringae]|nr:phage holin family protein [Pseudomonas syringae]MBD8576798.1 phage holin family protein [Pseudomonas syringae]MBD8788877.1 phage holin family protein [Pseudomonas syringae]MBD8803114.1 phage holin family protein [Pseudomonas syringae]MBD8813824.1 phage holin family protein [Pseudomonas syringae]